MFQFPYETKIEELLLVESGLTLKVEQLESLDKTIDDFFLQYQKSGKEELFGDLCPYFGVPWPAGRALADYVFLQKGKILEKKILEIGCGLALPSLALAKAGAKQLECSDLHPDVPEFLQRNQRLNQVQVSFRKLDWRKEYQKRAWDLILGSDVLYDRDLPHCLLEFLGESLSPGGEAWIADPGRTYWEAFLQKARESWRVEEILVTSGSTTVFFAKLHRRGI